MKLNKIKTLWTEADNAIRNLTGEYQKIEPECRKEVREKLVRVVIQNFLKKILISMVLGLAGKHFFLF